MSYIETIKQYEPQVGKKFSYDDAIKYWTALDEPNKIHKDLHTLCNQHNNNLNDESCISRDKIYDTTVENKKKATSLFNKTINNSALFSSIKFNNLLKIPFPLWSLCISELPDCNDLYLMLFLIKGQ